MFIKKFLHVLCTAALLFSLVGISLPQLGYAQTTSAVKSDRSVELSDRLSKIDEKVEARRKELGIPGMSLAIVKDGKVVHSKGYGYKNFEKQIPVTPDTQFAIGSATKAFTGLSVLISQDQAKLSLGDSPKKILPYFKINDAEIDKKITIRDLLIHSSGLNRTDLAWITGKLTREEVIKVAGEAKPTAKLGEKFQYQNVMFAAAGEIVSKVQKKSFENFISEDIFKPLEMNNSTVSISDMKKAKDFSFGYEYNFDTKATKLLPTREIVTMSPAGSINSSSNDMAKWLQFILNRGEARGKKIVSENGFEEWIKPLMKVAGNVSYGLGWFVQDWKGKKVVQHGGNIDGFNSMVALLPEENLGFVMLTNVSASSLGNELLSIVWEGMLSDVKEESKTAISMQGKKEIGKYKFVQAGFDLDVSEEDGKLVAKVPGQPTYILELVEGRKYRLSNAPSGFFITFKESSAYLEQPQGNFDLPKIGAESTKSTGEYEISPAVKALVGTYESEENKGQKIEIKEVDGKVSLVVGTQPPYPLEEREKDVFGSQSLPPTYFIKVKRNDDRKIAGFMMVQPEGEFPFKYIGETEKNTPEISSEELIVKVIDALGGEENVRKVNSRVTKFDIDFVHQGVKGAGVGYSMAPLKNATEITINALGKQIGTIQEYFDGTSGGESASFSRDEVYTGQRLEDVKFSSDFYSWATWKNDNKTKIEVRSTGKVNDEDAYIVSVKGDKSSAFTYYISTKSFLPLKLTAIVVSSTSSQRIPISSTFHDYKSVDGIMLPFKIISDNPGMGDVVITTKEIKHNVSIDPKKFELAN